MATGGTASHLASGSSTALVVVATGAETAMVPAEAPQITAEEEVLLPEGEFSPPKPPSAAASNDIFTEGSSDESPARETPRRSEAASYFAGKTEGNMITYLDEEGDYAIVPTKHAVLDALREPGEQPWMKKVNLFQQPPTKVVRDADTGKGISTLRASSSKLRL